MRRISPHILKRRWLSGYGQRGIIDIATPYRRTIWANTINRAAIMINIAAVLDCEKSVKWFERAAEQGDAETQFKLGNFYLLVKTASGISILTRLYVLLFDLFDYSRVGLIN